MTALIQRIQADSLAARKARETDRASFLTTLLSEASMAGKNAGNRLSTDEETIAVCAKFDKNIAELLKARPGDEAALREREWLSAYLPQKLDEAALSALIGAILADLGLAKPTGKDTGAIMGELKKRAPGQFDGAMASKLLKALSA